MSLYETDKQSIQDWLSEIRRHKLVLPRFQRPGVWGMRQVQKLLQSVMEQLPIGSVLLLRVGDKPRFKSRLLEGVSNENDGKSPTNMLLDGQQRLTALWRALNNDYKRKELTEFFLRIRPDKNTDKEELPSVEFVKFYKRKVADEWKLTPQWPEDPKEVFNRGLIPFRILNPFANDGFDWVKKVVPPDDSLAVVWDEIRDYREKIAHFEIPYIALKPETPPQAVLTAFTRLNTQGTSLSAFDIVVAYMEAHEIDLHQKVKDLKEEVTKLKYFQEVDDLDLLRTIVLLNNQRATVPNILKIKPDHLVQSWKSLISGTRRALAFIQQEGIPDSARLPVEQVLPVLFALWSKVPEGGLEEGAARRLLRKYLWRSFFSDQYERGGTAASLNDFRALSEKLQGNDVTVPCFEANLPTGPEDFIDVGSPKRKIRLARAILAVSLRAGASDIHDGKELAPEDAKGREYHHLFPRAFLRGRDEEPDKALNIALITQKANRAISAKSPEEYLREVAQPEQGGEKELKRRLRSHLVPLQPFFENNYETFLKDRAKMIYDAMCELVEGNDWSPQQNGGRLTD